MNKLTHDEKKNYLREYYTYSHPLFVLSLVGLIVGIGDRWLLQTFAGAEQQGFYSLAYRAGAIVFLFSSAMTTLFIREFSIAWKEQDYPLMKQLFNKLVPLFFFSTSFLAVFVAINGPEITLLLGGSDYQEAGIVLTIMALYPIHQTYGQMSGSIFYATGRTKLFRNIVIPIKLLGLIMTFIFIAPAEFGGFELGAIGLAIVMIVIQFIQVNVQLAYNTNLVNISFMKYFFHQILVISLLGILAYGNRLLLKGFFTFSLYYILVSGIVYLVLVALLVLMFPGLIFRTRPEVISQLLGIYNKILYQLKS